MNKVSNRTRIIDELFDLSGRTALVTGSSRGLGLMIAEGLARAGAKVALNGRNESALNGAIDALPADGLNLSGCPFDITDSTRLPGIIRAVEEEG